MKELISDIDIVINAIDMGDTEDAINMLQEIQRELKIKLLLL
jgi:type II secretory pathway component PulC